MTEATPKDLDVNGMLGEIKVWLEKNNWAYWVLAIFGVVGLIAVAVYLLRTPPKVEVQPK